MCEMELLNDMHSQASITVEDIQVFVLTYNRPDYLLRQLESLAIQTARPSSITVLDDGPNPETKKVVEHFANRGISYAHTFCSGLGENFYEAQKRADRLYTVMLHDDDQTHPKYFELATQVLRAHPECSLLGCNSFDLSPDTIMPFDANADTRGWLFNQRDFASFFFNGHFGHFPFFIYKTRNLKRLDACHYLNYDGPFGKHGDSAFVPLAVGDGKAAMLSSRLANYGCHPGQAVVDANSLPDAKCWARVAAVFHSLMGDDLRTFAGFSYAFRNYRYLRSGYKRRGTHDYSFAEYMDFAREIGAVSQHIDLFKVIGNHYTEKLMLKLYQATLRRKECLLI